METRKKIRKMVFLVTVWLIGWMLSAYPVQAKEMTGKEQAVDWVKQAASDDGEWKDQELPNLTCNALAVLMLENHKVESYYLSSWVSQQDTFNNDELAHLAWATKDAGYLDRIWESQNEDGGFGLRQGYTSDPYDTLLVLMAELSVREKEGDGVYPEAVQNAMDYLVHQQNEDGGFGYSQADSSRPGLSAEVGIVLQELQLDDSAFFDALDGYCQNAFVSDFSEDMFYEQAELARYLYGREIISDAGDVEQKLMDVQQDNGSVYGDGDDTLQYILLADAISQYHDIRFEIINWDVELDSYVLQDKQNNEMGIHSNITYKTNQNVNLKIQYTIVEDGKDIETKGTEQLFTATESVVSIENKELSVKPEIGKSYKLRIELLSINEENEQVLATKEIDVTVQEDKIDDLILNTNVENGEDYFVQLTWNDISNNNHRYGYRVMRKTIGGDWESKSTWDGTEIVRVLNVYPGRANFLKTWMNSSINNTEEIASRGVLEIDEVSIASYNKNPDKYLMDENGVYKYDVIMIGSADCNGSQDLSEKAYEATYAFTKSGRGILFGHDTVVNNRSQIHPNLAKFGEQLGIVYYKSDVNGSGTKVEVINEGFLTSYPWKLTGVLQIPNAHSSGQFMDMDLEHPATKWMRFYGYDSTDDAYLFSRDQYAMIQTGHSYGQATDDERKILANTLFYLKQYTDDTSATDHSFYDENAPKIENVSDVVNGQITLSAKDVGTEYQYYVEAIGERGDDNVQSNISEATALSGLQGFVVKLDDISGVEQDILTYDEQGNLTSEVIPAEQGILDYSLDALEPGQSGYLHIYAIDNAGNVSEEKIVSVTMPEQTPVVSDKEYLNLPYALFATEDVASVSCSVANINGDIYGGSSFFFQGSTLELAGTAMTPGTLSIAGGVLHLTDKQEGIAPISLPDYTDAIVKDIQTEQAPVEEINVYNSTEITSPVFCQKTTGAWCNDLSLRASLISEQGISFNTNTLNCMGDYPVVVCSKNGNITVQATKFNGSGLIYAPNGTVTINVSEFDYTGTIIAKKIVFQSGNVNMNQ